MKKILYTILTIATSLSVVSCEKFLDSTLLTQKTTDNFPATEQEATEMVTAIYAHLLCESPESSSHFYIAQLASDDCLGGNLSFSGNCATNFLLYKDNLNGYLGIWDRCYTLINRANNAIATLDNVKTWSNQSVRDRLMGEAYFLRAMAYYELVQTFGGVPLRTTIDAVNIPRSSVDDIYALIGFDLQAAIKLLPQQIYLYGSPMAGHATKAAAEALQARVFLFYTGRYAKTEIPAYSGVDGASAITKAQVITDLEDCINNSGHDLVEDQREIWGYTNDISNSNEAGLKYGYAVAHDLHWVNNSSIETVFANKHNLSSNWTYTWFSNTWSMFSSPSNDNRDIIQSYPFTFGWGAGPASPAMIEDWKAWDKNQEHTDGYTEDPRLTGSVWSYTAYDPNNKGNVLLDRKMDPSEPDYTVSYRYYEQTGYFQKKYINIGGWDDAADATLTGGYDGVTYKGAFRNSFALVEHPTATGQTSAQLLQTPDLIHIRFADVLLMHSELTGTADGINKVRARSHLAPVTYSLQALKNERRYELAFESIRWYDLLRWSGPSLQEASEALNKQTGFDLINEGVVVPMVRYDYASRLQSTQGYWPIPQTEIDIAGKDENGNDVLEQNPGWGADAAFIDWNNFK